MNHLPTSGTGKRAPDASRAGRGRCQLGREYELTIGGQRIKTEGQISSVNPRALRSGGWHSSEGRRRARRAGMQAALHAFESWSMAPTAERSPCFSMRPKIIRARKFEFCACSPSRWARIGQSDADVGRNY